jgi:hypothetical protein
MITLTESPTMATKTLLRLPVAESRWKWRPTDPNVLQVAEDTTVEFDLIGDTVKLPRGFVCSLTSLAHIVGRALIAQEELRQGHHASGMGSKSALKKRGKNGPYL